MTSRTASLPPDIPARSQHYYGPDWERSSGQQALAAAPIVLADAAHRTQRTEEDMHHPETMWTEPANAQYPLQVLWSIYEEHLAGRTKPASPATIRKYKYTLTHFMRSLELRSESAVLASLTPFAVERWIADSRNGRIPRFDHQKQAKMNESGIASNLAALKAFTRKFIWRHLEMTTRDLLERVDRYEPTPPVKDGLTSDEMERTLSCYDDDEYESVRDKAMIAFYAATGLRLSEVLFLRVNMVDQYSGWVKTTGKGGKERVVKLGERALKYLRAYLRIRKASRTEDALWTSDFGRPLSLWGGHGVFRRLKRKSGVEIAHAHRFRHSWAQTALKKGAERALVQDAMGWTSDAMVRRYGGWVRSQTAAAAMPQYAPI